MYDFKLCMVRCIRAAIMHVQAQGPYENRTGWSPLIFQFHFWSIKIFNFWDIFIMQQALLS